MQKITHQPCFLIRDIKLQYSLNHCTTCIFSFFKLIIFLLLSFRKRKTASMSRWFRKKAMINISLELFQDEIPFSHHYRTWRVTSFSLRVWAMSLLKRTLGNFFAPLPPAKPTPFLGWFPRETDTARNPPFYRTSSLHEDRL